jgi:hypothetical protein
MTFSLPETLYKKMKKYPEIKWSHIARGAIEKYLERLELTDKIASKSKLKEEDVESLSEEIKRRSWEKFQPVLDD